MFTVRREEGSRRYREKKRLIHIKKTNDPLQAKEWRKKSTGRKASKKKKKIRDIF